MFREAFSDINDAIGRFNTFKAFCDQKSDTLVLSDQDTGEILMEI